MRAMAGRYEIVRLIGMGGMGVVLLGRDPATAARVAIKVLKPDQETLARAGVHRWPIWEKETSKFDWTYGDSETCLVLEGRVRVTPRGGQPVEFGPGDVVVFPAGMECVWEVLAPIRKHYAFGETPFSEG